MDPLVRRKLGRTNIEVTQLGLGGAGLGDLFDVVEDADANATLQAAWDAGIRYYETSPWYGRGPITCCPPKSVGCFAPSMTRRISSTVSGAAASNSSTASTTATMA